MNRNVATLLCALMLLIAGCGGEKNVKQTPVTTAEQTPPPTAEKVIDEKSLVFRENELGETICYEINSEVGFSGLMIKRDFLGNKTGEYLFENGKKEGKGTEWSTITKRKHLQATYKNGKIQGKYAEWYSNGAKKLEGNYKNGRKEGVFTEWHYNGQKEKESNHKDGKLDGKYTVWHDNGQKEEEATFKNGKKVGRTRWDKNGREY